LLFAQNEFDHGGVKLSGVAKVCIIPILILTLSLSGSMAQFGSKVVSGDVDVGRLLESFPDGTPSLGYWDGSSGGYSGDDVVYLDISSNNRVDANDIRLTPYEGNPAGSKVMLWDNDINKPLDPMPGNDSGIYFLDLYGSVPGYDLWDPVYIMANAVIPTNIRTTTNDIRLSEVNGLAPGTRVLDFHPDHDKVATDMIAPFKTLPNGTMATIRFYNGNGNVNLLGDPLYDAEDDVYLDISLPDAVAFGFVVPNNLRLSG
jgi:hypothetical protein